MSNLLTPARANTSPSTKSGMMDLAALLQLQQQRQQLEQLQLRQEQQQSRDALMRVLLLQQQVASASTNTAVNRVSPSASVATSASTSAPTMSASLDRERREQKMSVADALFRMKNSSSTKAAAAAAASKNKKNAQEEEPPKTSQEDPRQSQLLREILRHEGAAAMAKREFQLQMLRALASPATSRTTQEQGMLALLIARATPGSMTAKRLSSSTASFSSLSEASSQPSASDTAVSSTASEILRLQLRARLQSASRTGTGTATLRSTSSSGAVNRLLEQKQILELLARNQEPMRIQPAPAAPKPEEDAQAMDTTSTLSSKKARGRTSRFPKILHQVLLEMDVSQGSTSGRPIAGFSKDGKSFAIHNLKEFFVQVGATHFKMSSFASFQRQLNLYNFQKLHTGSAGGAYKHPLFQRDQPELLETLRRTKIKSSPTGK